MAENRVSFSVAVSSYNYGAFAEQSLAAIVAQDLKPDEIIVIDDASTDDSVDIIRKFIDENSAEISLIQHAENKGPYEVHKAAFARVTSEFVFGLGIDDPVLPGMFRESVALLSSHPYAGICFSDYQRLFSDGSQALVTHHLGDRPVFLTPDQFLTEINRQQRFSIPTSTCAWNLEKFRAVTSRDVSDLKWHYDWFIAFVLAFRHGVCYVPKPMQMVRVSEHSYSLAGSNNSARQADVIKAFLNILEQPEFSDVRPYFIAAPSVISRFGKTLLEVIESNPEYRGYMSKKLETMAIKAESYNNQRKEMISSMVT